MAGHNPLITRYDNGIHFTGEEMTAEIVIMNRESIAIAADSAVSLMGGQTERPQKIFTSASKIFELAPEHSLCFMIFNYASFMGIPWEIIFTHYRKNIKNTSFMTTEECAKSFIDFLANETDLVPSDGEENYFMTNTYHYFLSIKQSILQNASDLVKTSGEITEDKVMEVPASTIKGLYDTLISAPYATSMAEEDFTSLLATYEEKLTQAITDVFEALPLNEEATKQLKSIPVLFFVKSTGTLDPLSQDFSGVVIAGFGEKDIFPSLVTYWIEGRLNKKLKYTERNNIRISFKNGAEIVPFAQHEMVDIFLSGMDAGLEEALLHSIGETLHTYPESMIDSIEEISDEMKSKYKRTFQVNTDEIMKNLTEELNNYRLSNFAPIINVVVALPKSELAAMAESLVNITSLKRRVSMQAETVGGPVDVAVISKKDGFVWIKRKQYYSASLNLSRQATSEEISHEG
jgi:ATP-dependent protease HslVU (ClpYQ) peptidase subunit